MDTGLLHWMLWTSLAELWNGSSQGRLALAASETERWRRSWNVVSISTARWEQVAHPRPQPPKQRRGMEWGPLI